MPNQLFEETISTVLNSLSQEEIMRELTARYPTEELFIQAIVESINLFDKNNPITPEIEKRFIEKYREYKNRINSPEYQIVEFKKSLLINVKDQLRNTINVSEEQPLTSKFFDTFSNPDISNKSMLRQISKIIEKMDANNEEKIKNILINALESYPYGFKQEIAKIIEFLKESKKPVYKKMNRTQVAFELFKELLFPSAINQGDSNLCGMASFLSALTHLNPMLFVDMTLELAKTGTLHPPFAGKAHPESLANDTSITFALMAAIRHNNNITGYSNHSFRFLEPYRGTTRPKTIVKLLEQCNLPVKTEATIITYPNQEEIYAGHRAMLGGVYANNHQTFKDKEENLQHLVERLKNKDIGIMLISIDLTKKFTHDHEEIEQESTFTILGIESRHWVYIDELKIKNNIVTATIETYGERKICDIPIEHFLKGYYGAIIVEAEHNNELKIKLK